MTRVSDGKLSNPNLSLPDVERDFANNHNNNINTNNNTNNINVEVQIASPLKRILKSKKSKKMINGIFDRPISKNGMWLAFETERWPENFL